MLAVGVVAMAAGACGSSDDGGRTGADDRVEVVAGFYPLAEAARRVGGEAVRVTDLTPGGAEPHDLELSSRDVDRIEDADVVVYLGGGFQPAVEKAAERASGDAIDLLDDEDDPHVWLDPRRMQAIASTIADALAEADPAGAAGYEAREAAYLEELQELDRAFETGLATCERRVIVTSHDAFGHLAARYDLEQEPIAGVDPEAEPDPRRLAALVDEVKARGVTTIFSEALVSPEVAETLAREAGVRTAVLDPIEGLSDERRAAGDDYVSVMRENLEALRLALGCT